MSRGFLWFLIAASTPAVSEALDVPEKEISKITSQLKDISLSLKSENAIKNIPGQGTGKSQSFKSLEDSIYWFSKGNWLATIRELKRYERGTNTHIAQNLLQYHYLYGKSEASLGNYAAAIVHFKAFLADSSKLSQLDPEKTNDVLASVIDCLLKEKSPRKGLELKQNISAILVAEHGTESAFEAHFLAGRLAVIDRSPDLAMDWLNQATKSNSKATTTRGLFYQALLAISRDDSDGAYEILLKAESLSRSSEISTYHDQVLLALGRVEFYRKHYKESLSWLEKVDSKSTEYHAALRESIHAATSAMEYGKALKLSDLFLAAFPQSQYLHEVDLYRSFLVLQTVSSENDAEFYKNRIQKLESIASELKESALGRERITEAHLATMISKVKSVGNPGSIAENGQDLFSKINRLEDRANFVSSSVIEQYNWLASKPFSTIFPDDTIRGRELGNKCEEIADLANRISTLSLFIFENDLSLADREAVTRSSTRREFISSESSKFQRNFENIGGWVLGQAQLDKLRDIRALSIQQLAIQNSHSKNSNQIEVLSLQKKIERRVSELSLEVQKNTTSSLSSLSPYLAHEKFILQYSLAMAYELSKFKTYLTPTGDYTTRELKKSLLGLWTNWFQVSEELYRDVITNQNSLQTKLNRQLSDLEEHSKMAAETVSRAAWLRGDLELAMGKSGSLLVNQFLGEITSRLSETHEWMAESKMKKLEQMQKDHNKAREKSELERQKIAEDYLDTTQSGVTK